MSNDGITDDDKATFDQLLERFDSVSIAARDMTLSLNRVGSNHVANFDTAMLMLAAWTHGNGAWGIAHSMPAGSHYHPCAALVRQSFDCSLVAKWLTAVDGDARTFRFAQWLWKTGASRIAAGEKFSTLDARAAIHIDEGRQLQQVAQQHFDSVKRSRAGMPMIEAMLAEVGDESWMYGVYRYLSDVAHGGLFATRQLSQPLHRGEHRLRSYIPLSTWVELFHFGAIAPGAFMYDAAKNLGATEEHLRPVRKANEAFLEFIREYEIKKDSEEG